jgi:hypothetical protein
MMRKRSNGLLAIISFLAMLLIVPALCHADELGFGSGWFNGHSDDGSYSMMNDGDWTYGFVLHYEKDWLETDNKKFTFGMDPGMMYTWVRWTKGHNKEREICEEGDCWDRVLTSCEIYYPCQEEECHTEKYKDNETINSHILAGYLKPYLEIHKRVRLFGLAGAGVEIADDQSNPAIVYGGGLQIHLTDHLSTSATVYEIFADPTGEYRRYDATILSLDYRW